MALTYKIVNRNPDNIKDSIIDVYFNTECPDFSINPILENVTISMLQDAMIDAKEFSKLFGFLEEDEICILCIIDGDQDFFLTLRNHISSFVEDAWNEACAKDRKKHNGVLELEHTDYWSIYKNDIDQLEKSLIKDK
tara:strand:- start:7016 stop:7426 length:411 start_codon:yes stop_codon:yes gene_type:complete